MSRPPADVSKLSDDLLTGEEYGKRHFEALRNPRHPDHARVTAGFSQQCALDCFDQGADPHQTLGPNGEAPCP
jgi:hypothetical protein